MARVYYKKKELIGTSINHNAINPTVFNNIMTKTAPAKDDYFTINIKSELITFSKALVWDGDFWFTHKEHEIYLPKAILFGDDFQLPFPDEYFFVAYIQGEIELRKVYAGKGVTFLQTLNLSEGVIDKSEISKVDNSMIVIHKMLNQFEEKSLAYPQGTESSSKILEAYDAITAMCGWTKPARDLLLEHLRSLNLRDAIYEIRDAVLDYCYDTDKALFIYCDWKDCVEEFVCELQEILKQNFEIEVVLPLGDYNLETQIFEEGVLEYFNTILHQYQIELLCLNTDGDDYQFIINKIDDHEEIIQNIKTIGFEIDKL